MIPSAIRGAGLALWCAVAAGCGDRPERSPEPPDVAEVFPNLPLPAHPSVVSRSGGADALQLTLRTPQSAESVEKYYLEVLSGDGWRLLNQTRRPNGELVLYAEQDGPPLWVRIRRADDGAGTIVDLAGARSQPTGRTGAKAKPAS